MKKMMKNRLFFVKKLNIKKIYDIIKLKVECYASTNI